MALDKQINLFKVDTNAFLTNEERNIRSHLVELKKRRELLRKELPKYSSNDRQKYDKEKNIILHKQKENVDVTYIELEFLKLEEEIKLEEKKCKDKLLEYSKAFVENNINNPDNKVIRQLDERYVSYKDIETGEKRVNLSNVIAMFESTLSRSFGITTNELTYDIFIVEIFYYDIAKDLIINGFNYNGKHYVYFSSSAGQIRTKKAVFVEEQKYLSCQKKLMCGLTVDHINNQGGMNINKYLAYLALANSATDLWRDVFGKDFDIDRCIVVDDFETNVKCKVDNINYETYEITKDVIQDMPIPHTDGCGMILSSYSSKNFMVRLPFIKGLLGSFDFIKFINENNCSHIIKDIWGKEYNIIDDNIQIIFTKSQLKMYKYYESWDQYKEYFKMYNCEAGVCNMEEDYISNAKINYQMLQTLHDASDEEIKELCNTANNKILNVCSSLESALSFFGVSLEDGANGKDYYQKSLMIYPELLSDLSARSDLRDLKNSLVKKYKGAHIDVSGKFTFVLPDLYAFCEWLFMEIETPKGLLENNEVFCRLYKNDKKLDCLRSPHLYIEHAIRNNVCNKKYRNQNLSDWFNTDAIYTSTYDLISRILQFDVDGDRLLVINQPKIIEMAERCMNGVNPLYYEMRKAKAELITPSAIYEGLRLAFTGGNIGGISNDITKIWNSEHIDNEALNAVKWLCMETNFTIDYAKTLFKPDRPAEVDNILKAYGNKKVPYFFQFAKDKKKNQCEDSNNSTINRISNEIKDNRTMFRSIKKLEKIDYKLFLKNMSDSYTNDDINAIFDKWNKKYGNNINLEEDNKKNNLVAIALQVKEEFNRIESDDDKVLNSLVSFLYKSPSTRKKKLLWYIYGDKLYQNLSENLSSTNLLHKSVCRQCGKRTDEELVRGKCFECRQAEIKNLNGFKLIKCIDCGCEFEVSANSRMKRCEKCKRIERSIAASKSRKSKMLTSSFQSNLQKIQQN